MLLLVAHPVVGTLIFSHIRFSGHFWGFKILNFNIFAGFQKMNIFGGIKILWIFLWGYHKIGLFLGVISMHFRVFLLDQGTAELRYFLELLKLQIFFGVA